MPNKRCAAWEIRFKYCAKEKFKDSRDWLANFSDAGLLENLWLGADGASC